VGQISDIDFRYPGLADLISDVCSQNPFQRRKIEAFLQGQDDDYFDFAEDLLQRVGQSIWSTDEDRGSSAQAYNKMCLEMLSQEIKFKKTGKYPEVSASQVREQVYEQYSSMKMRVIGLLLTYILWPNHYHMFRLFKEYLGGQNIKNYLEVGAGHGLFLAEALQHNEGMNATIIDISQASIDVSAEILEGFGVDPAAVTMLCGDFLTFNLHNDRFDFIVMGEVIEHVDDPLRFLRTAKELLSSDGTIYMSTCANCPSVDHVYHFHDVEQIRELIQESGLAIELDDAVASRDVSGSSWESELVPVNYSSFLHLN
jgi:2-polyprenyl-3-methyl-5-hydroxy-6-metoxy-1,4-benzoquinol methylase